MLARLVEEVYNGCARTCVCLRVGECVCVCVCVCVYVAFSSKSTLWKSRFRVKFALFYTSSWGYSIYAVCAGSDWAK